MLEPEGVVPRPAIVLLGSPGAGKGTLAQRLEQELGLVHVEVGALLRARAAQGDAVGNRIAVAQARGAMVPKELVLDLLCAHLETLDPATPLVLDGFPRTTAQVAAADDGRVPVDVSAVFWLDVPPHVAALRLSARRAASARLDDDARVVAKRIDLVAETVDAVRALYEQRGILEWIDASQSPDAVFAQVVARLEPVVSPSG